jgi:DNA-directed RNA polymerase II subunit RPB2
MGEMETWCGISHGASSFLIDRLVNNSDGYEMYVCDHCGNPAIATIKTQRFECKNCEQNTAISKIRLPYAFKLLMQELQACGIGVWFNVDTQKTLASAAAHTH